MTLALLFPLLSFRQKTSIALEISARTYTTLPFSPPLLLLLALSPAAAPTQPLRPPTLSIPLRKPLARLHQLHDVEYLLARHDGEADTRDDPGPEGVHLVGARELHRPGAAGRGEDVARRVGRAAGLRGGARVSGVRWEEGWGEDWGGEGEEVKSDEEEFVEGAEDEEDGL